MNTTTASFSKCRCQHCNGHIEFESEQAGQIVSCPHCALETMLYRITPARPETKRRRALPGWVKGLIVVALIVGGIIGTVLLLAKFATPEGLMGAGLAVGGAIYLALWFAAFVLAVFWVVFPILVYLGIRRMEKLLAQIERNSRK